MKILVTGGAGFIGSHVCDTLLARGDKVSCVDNFNDYYDPRIKEGNIQQNLVNHHFRLFRADILDQEQMRAIFDKERPDKVIHLAARAGVRPSINNPWLYEEVNVKGTLNMLELAKTFGVKSFVFASSSSIYGNRENGPFSETDEVSFPISPYAATKKAGEELCYTYHYLYRLSISCLRFFTVYGPRGRPEMAHLKFTRLIDAGKEIEIYGDGSSRRDYTYISDIVSGVIAALEGNFGYEIFNLGNSVPIELNYLISLLEKNLGKKAKRKYGEKRLEEVGMTFADLRKSEKMLGYKPKVKIEEGVVRMIAWYKALS